VVGLGQAVAATTVGYLTAAAATPLVARRIGKTAWIVLLFAVAALAQAGGGLPFSPAPLLVGAAFVGLASAGAKICVDTIVQEQIDDDFRGRVFSFYDTLFNVAFVVAAVVAAFTLPRTGRSTPVVLVMSLGYAVIALVYGAAERRARREAATASPAEPAPV
jgi:MFS family permease